MKEDFGAKGPQAEPKDASEQPDQPKGSRGPDKPQLDGEYKLNLGFWRLETINDILVACARKYKKAIRKRDEKSIYEYQAMVNTLFTETFIYMEQETEIEEKGVQLNKEDVLKTRLDEKEQFANDQEALEHLQDVRAVYLSVRQLMKEVGLDIPKKETISDIDIFNQT